MTVHIMIIDGPVEDYIDTCMICGGDCTQEAKMLHFVKPNPANGKQELLPAHRICLEMDPLAGDEVKLTEPLENCPVCGEPIYLLKDNDNSAFGLAWARDDDGNLEAFHIGCIDEDRILSDEELDEMWDAAAEEDYQLRYAADSVEDYLVGYNGEGQPIGG